MESTPILKTARLLLRPFRPGDAPALLEILGDREVNRFLPMFPLENLPQAEAYLEGLDQDVIFRTPGLHPGHPALEAARARGAEVTSEMELFFRLCPCRLIGVTGSDGKTTTTSIIAEMLKAAKYGFLVENGSPALREEVPFLAPPNTSSGVMQVLRRVLAQNGRVCESDFRRAK